jgi:F0F1-type ATP synthase gamma subunit
MTKITKNITSLMEMVSAAKLKEDKTHLAAAISFNKWTYEIYSEPTLMEDATFDKLPKKCLVVPFTSDKGHFGGVI